MTERLPRTTAEMLLRVLARDGWFVTRQSGSHVVMRHGSKPGRVVVPRHRSKTIKLATMAAILEEAELSPEEFRRLL
ncbi:MAG: type II toxin-antitoxin system HicA family toxin [Dehalococcoidia bacterium]|nr:type II toxin-antitoxin system HicA family toxin [Dehalococcoidia bacterium]